jgi:hypothetical protein
MLVACPFQRVGSLLDEAEALRITTMSERLLVTAPAPQQDKVLATEVRSIRLCEILLPGSLLFLSLTVNKSNNYYYIVPNPLGYSQ